MIHSWEPQAWVQEKLEGHWQENGNAFRSKLKIEDFLFHCYHNIQRMEIWWNLLLLFVMDFILTTWCGKSHCVSHLHKNYLLTFNMAKHSKET